MSEPLRRPQPATWWLQRGAYFQFMMRELSALFIAAWLTLFVGMICRLLEGPEAYEKYLKGVMFAKPTVVFHFVALAFALLHSFTWFNSTPKSMTIWRGEEKLPDAALIAPNYVALVVFTAFLFWLVR